MQPQNSVIQIQNYGKIRLKLKAVMDARGISHNSLATAIHARFEVIDKWYNGNVEKIDADILARICYTLQCKVEDVLEYVE